MAETKVYSYMLTLLINGKLIKGLVTSGLSIKPNFEELILKADEGVAQKEQKDADLEMNFAGKTIERDTSETSTHEDFETLRNASILGTEVTFSYFNSESGLVITGSGNITSFQETAGSEKIMADYSGTITAKSGDVVDTAALGRKWSDYLALLWVGDAAGSDLICTDGRRIAITGKDFTGPTIPAASNATFTMPDDADLIAADVDEFWFTSGLPNAVSVADMLAGDTEAENIVAIALFKPGETFSSEEKEDFESDLEELEYINDNDYLISLI